MKITLYEHSDDFLKDNKEFIYKNSLQADLMFGNAHSSLSCEQGFYGASVKNGDDILLSCQITPFPRVHFSNCSDPDAMTQLLVDSYVETNQIPDEANGDKTTINSLVKALANHSIKYSLHSDLVKLKCTVLNDVATLPLKIKNAKSIDFDFKDFYISFCEECNLPFDSAKVVDKANTLKSSGNLYVLIDKGEVVTLAATNRKTQHGRAVNFVFTPLKFRSKGYSICCVKQVTNLILQETDYAFLYADKNNLISNHVYEKLGFHVFDEFCQYKRQC